MKDNYYLPTFGSSREYKRSNTIAAQLSWSRRSVDISPSSSAIWFASLARLSLFIKLRILPVSLYAVNSDFYCSSLSSFPKILDTICTLVSSSISTLGRASVLFLDLELGRWARAACIYPRAPDLLEDNIDVDSSRQPVNCAIMFLITFDNSGFISI